VHKLTTFYTHTHTHTHTHTRTHIHTRARTASSKVIPKRRSMSALSLVYPSPRSARSRSISAFLNMLKTASNPPATVCHHNRIHSEPEVPAGTNCQPPLLYIQSIYSFATAEWLLRPEVEILNACHLCSHCRSIHIYTQSRSINIYTQTHTHT